MAEPIRTAALVGDKVPPGDANGQPEPIFATHSGSRFESRRDSAASTYRKTLLKIEQLHMNLMELERRCRAIEPGGASASMSEFKRLSPVFEEVLSFIAVIETHTAELEEHRRVEVEAQLALLRRRLAKLHVETAEPLLARVESSREPLALGTRNVMDRWLAYVDQISQRLTAGATEEAIAADLASVERVRALSRTIADRSIDLPDFSQDMPPAADEPEEDGPARPLLTSHRRAQPALPSMIRFAVRQSGNRYYLDPRGSSTMLVEVRRGNLQPGLAAALGVDPGNLVMVLNGRDPFSQEKMNAALEFLKRQLGEHRVELLTS
ncbi:MAG TPA: hypothetical protein VED40_05405 [Azospirillaceae bacterium]|nr:hypothetical protein [Azospirillaceae bacterium]